MRILIPIISIFLIVISCDFSHVNIRHKGVNDVAYVEYIEPRSHLDTLYDVISEMESGGNSDAVGVGGKAYGEVQIRKICIDDINRIYSTCYVHDDAFNEDCSREIFKKYLEAGTALYIERHRVEPTKKDLVRMWNGGIYSGYKKVSTIRYWKKSVRYAEKLNMSI